MTVHSATGAPDKGDKRVRILGAAERIFARRGFFASRVSEIAKEAGVADGTIYLYFKSKDELLISLFEERMKQVNDALARAIADLSPVEQLRAFAKTYLRLIESEPAYSFVTARLLLNNLYAEAVGRMVGLKEAGEMYRDYFPRFLEDAVAAENQRAAHECARVGSRVQAASSGSTMIGVKRNRNGSVIRRVRSGSVTA